MVAVTLALQDILPCTAKSTKFNLDAVLPYLLLPGLLLIAVTSRIVTAIVMVVIAMGALYVYTRPRQKNRSPFFFSWTLASCLTMLLVFEFGILGQLMVTQLEHLVFLVLLGCTSYFFYKLKAVADFILAKGSSKGKEYSPVLTAESQYCEICQIEVNERYFHSIWWDCCVFRPNYGYFLAGQVFGFATLLYGTNLGLSTLCMPWENYEDVLSYFYYYCNDVYFDFTLTISFVTCVYGIGYLFVIALVLIRQLLIYIPKYNLKSLFCGKQKYQQVSQMDI